MLVFENPDDILSNKEISFEECKLFYEECLSVNADNKIEYKNIIKERDAFYEAFKELKGPSSPKKMIQKKSKLILIED